MLNVTKVYKVLYKAANEKHISLNLLKVESIYLLKVYLLTM